MPAKPVAGYRQPWRLAGLAFGGALPEGWASDGRRVDFYDVKGDIEALLAPAVLRFEKLLIRRCILVALPV
jgi:phenylalanyl-tRNA synthetase beta chain